MEQRVRLTALDNNRPLTLYFESVEEAKNWADGRELTLVEIRILAVEEQDPMGFVQDFDSEEA